MISSVNRKSLWLGLIFVFILGSVSWLLADFFPRVDSVTMAIILGIVVGNIPFSNQMVLSGGLFAEKKLLPIAITLLGVELKLMTLFDLGFVAIIVIAVSILVSIFTSIYLGKLLNFSPKFSVLIGAGNGICGSSAIAATSIVIDAEESDIGISISVVNLLGTIGIFLIPAMIRLFPLSNLEGGLLIGGTLQALGQVVGAGFSVNDDVGNIATVVKMGRVLMLGPMVVLIGSWMRSKLETNGEAPSKVVIPYFIVGFFVMSIIASLNILPSEILTILKTLGKYLLVVAMVGIGMRIQLSTLYHSGLSAFLFGGLVSVIQIIITLIVIIVIA